MKHDLEKEKKEILDACYDNVKCVLEDNRKMFDKVLKVLMKKGTMSGDEFVELINDEIEEINKEDTVELVEAC